VFTADPDAPLVEKWRKAEKRSLSDNFVVLLSTIFDELAIFFKNRCL